MPKDDINYKFTENGIVYDFYDVFVPAENFRQPTLFVWGNNNNNGQLGTNDTTTKSTPVTTFAGGTTWKSVVAGWNYMAAIKTDGTLWSWGDNTSAQLGVNDAFTQRNTPVTTFIGGNNWKQISCGNVNTAAIKTDGSLWTWGAGTGGRLGTNDATQRNTPVTTFAGGNNWKQVSCGEDHTAAIKTDGSLWTWGLNTSAQLGTNDGTNRSTPVTTFAGGNNWKQVSCGFSATAATKTDGTLWTWGRNNTGNLGTNDTTNRSTPVTTFAGGNDWKQVGFSRETQGAIKTDGSLWIWGTGTNGQLGNNATTNRSTPVTTFIGGNNWKQISCGNVNTAAIKTDGSLWTWGLGGRLGTNDATQRNTPVTTFAGGNNWKQVSITNSTSAIKYSPDP
jgi:alpha-tubulin suppressor-like RCC1 family protein